MNVERIVEILADCLGEVVEGKLLSGTEVVDVWQNVPLKRAKVEEHQEEMIELLKEWPHESWGQSIPSLGQEISYLVAGAVLGDQSRAFLLFAFGKLLDWWDILDPRTMLGLEKDNPVALQMAGGGLVAIDGFRPPATN